MLSAPGRFNQSGLRAACGLMLLLSFPSSFVWGQEEAAADSASCEAHQTTQVRFTEAETPDTLAIDVSGGPCSEATALISVTRADGFPVYHYEARLIEIMPQLIYEPELAKLMSSYVGRALHRALLRSTIDLPEYSDVARYYETTGDFVVVDQERYEALRQENVPILWHKTGESTWVHVVYDPLTSSSQVIMRGGTL